MPAATVLREAELFATAETMLVEVLGRIRPGDRELLLPPLPDLPGPDARLGSVVTRFVVDEGGVPERLAGRPPLPPEGGTGSQADVVRVVAAAVAAARGVEDGEARVPTPHGPLPARRFLLRLAVTRSLLAHYVAAYLGSTACPLPEQLADDLLTATTPDLAAWRAAGIFGPSLPVPALASRRDTFLLTAGHLPHPRGH